MVTEKKPAPYYDGMKIFNERVFPPEGILYFETDDLPVLESVRVDTRASTNLEAFSWPQLMVKHSWKKSSGRFHARLCLTKDRTAILCNQSYMSVHAKTSVLEAACVSHNSKIAVYFHFLTSGRFAAYRPKLSKAEILGLPIPYPAQDLLDGVEGYPTLDDRAFRTFWFERRRTCSH